jgi:hypothetical protein
MHDDEGEFDLLASHNLGEAGVIVSNDKANEVNIKIVVNAISVPVPVRKS